MQGKAQTSLSKLLAQFHEFVDGIHCSLFRRPYHTNDSDDRYALERFQAAKIHYIARHRLPAGVAPVIWGAGPTGRLTHDLLRKEGRLVSGFIEVHPRRIGGEKRGLPVWPVEWLRSNPDAFVLVAVGAAGARAKIRRFLDDLGRTEGEHYLFVA